MPRKPAMPGIERRQQMLEAALEIFAEQGFEAATNKAIAGRAGVNQGLIYFYFASKADIYFATVAYHTEQILARLDAVFAQESDSEPVEDLRRLLRQIMLILSVPPASQILRTLYQNAVIRTPPGELSNQEARQAVSGIPRHLTLRFREYLESHISSGVFRNLNTSMVANLLTRGMLVTFGGVVRDGRAKIDPDAMADVMVDLYCYGLLPRNAPTNQS